MVGWGLVTNRDALWSNVLRGKYRCEGDLLPFIDKNGLDQYCGMVSREYGIWCMPGLKFLNVKVLSVLGGIMKNLGCFLHVQLMLPSLKKILRWILLGGIYGKWRLQKDALHICGFWLKIGYLLINSSIDATFMILEIVVLAHILRKPRFMYQEIVPQLVVSGMVWEYLTLTCTFGRAI